MPMDVCVSECACASECAHVRVCVCMCVRESERDPELENCCNILRVLLRPEKFSRGAW